MASQIQSQPLQISSKTKGFLIGLMVIGLLGFLVTLFKDKERAWFAYLIAYFYFVSLSLGGLFIVAILHATNAGWSANIRRFPEALTAFLIWGFVGGLVFLIGAPHVYEWLDKAAVAKDALLQHKAGYLNFGFFAVRMVLFVGSWVFFARKLVGFSTRQDQTGDESLTLRAVPYAIAFLLSFALSYSLFGVDLLMSLQPHWFSTIFGVYCFAGLFQSSLALVVLLVGHCMKRGLLKGIVDENHLHDLGKFLFAFTVFWAYIAYSQYMLIWYANLPEETQFFIPRSLAPWAWISISLIFFKFIIPFLYMLPRWVKRNPDYLKPVAILLLIMQYVDVYWMAYPNLSKEHLVFGLPEILVFLGFAGAFFYAVTGFLGKYPIVPLKDPRQQESLHHHVVY